MITVTCNYRVLVDEIKLITANKMIQVGIITVTCSYRVLVDEIKLITDNRMIQLGMHDYSDM